ncbi:hypothetical protein [Paenibacillus abyssi]|uniref:hypothetical protein n=1 Tax=Paenibacillus abyssi TaxID=1340531 RepID=UPI0016688397|nr:hypothetical protein [Paenibacillus abyssi]
MQEHVSDIQCVVSAAGVDRFHLFSYSRGVSYALGFANEAARRVVSMIIQDYPAEHKQMPADWPDDYIHND